MPDRSPQLQEEDARAATSAFTAPQINLPKGGGAIRGIGEKFSANSVTGTGSMAVPIAVSQSRSGFMPQLTLTYDSGAGNGVFGMGWSLPLPGITRKTDKGLPQYRDAEESDIFILSGAEDLVPVLEPEKGGGWRSDEFERDGYRVKRYRPRVEGLFSRIERWTRLTDDDIHWRSFSKDNVLTLYGTTRESRIGDPANDRHIFSWLICASYDDKGDAIAYEYAAEDERVVDLTGANERNRVRTANRYLKRIRYGNRQPMRGDFPAHEGGGWVFEIVFDYGDEDVRDAPAGGGPDRSVEVGDATNPWPVRRDPFSTYRSAFETRTVSTVPRRVPVPPFSGRTRNAALSGALDAVRVPREADRLSLDPRGAVRLSPPFRQPLSEEEPATAGTGLLFEPSGRGIASNRMS